MSLLRDMVSRPAMRYELHYEKGVDDKRVIGLLSFACYVAMAFIMLFTGRTVPEYVLNGFMVIVLGVFVSSAMETWSSRVINPHPPMPPSGAVQSDTSNG